MPEYRVTITHWLDDETKSKVKEASLGLAEKSGDEEDLTATAYTEILIGAPDRGNRQPHRQRPDRQPPGRPGLGR